MYAVEAAHLTKIFTSARKKQNVTALSDFTLRVAQGEIFGLLGPNGAGKTTFIKLLLSIVFPSEGEAKILGKPVSDISVKERIGYLPENHRYPPYLKGEQVLDYFGKLSGVPDDQRRRRTTELLTLLGMEKWRGVKIRKYSKGMMQRIGIAQALINDPDLIFLDEPTDGVDPIARKEIRDLLVRLKNQGKTIFVNSHLLSEVEMISDRVAILHKGKLIREGSVRELTESRAEYQITLTAPLPDDLRTEWSARQVRFRTENNTIHLTLPALEEVNGAIDALRSRGCLIETVVPKKSTLEEMFITLIQQEEK
jgi:ABC-2 type transport system ATP-binding protein